MEIRKVNFPETQYYKQWVQKKIIVLHHTVSGLGIEGDVNWWIKTPERVATAFLIPRGGGVTQIFDESFWAHHLGIKQYMLSQFGSKVSNDRLNQLSIGIELDSWGGLVKKAGKWYNYAGGVVEPCNVQEYPKGFRGYFAYEKYDAGQIADLRNLLLHLKKKWGISLRYNAEMWDFNRKAMVGTHGLWTHVSYRPDKSDCHPQPELIEMLKSLEP